MKLHPRSLVFVVFVLLVTPGLALACPVCFGNVDGPIARGMNLAILALLGITGGILTSFAAFFFYLAKQARLARQGSDRWTDEPLKT